MLVVWIILLYCYATKSLIIIAMFIVSKIIYLKIDIAYDAS